MSFDYKIVPLPPIWPAKETSAGYRRTPPFKPRTNWVRHIAREVDMLNGRNVTIAIDVDDRHINQAGTLYANARPRSPRVILSFDVKDGRLQFPADTFTTWLANIDAIARVMEDLRRAERYGVRAGAQYTGFKAIPAATTATMSVADAVRILTASANGSGKGIEHALTNTDAARALVRAAFARAHPDAGGTSDQFQRVQQARAILSAHHGGKL